MDREKLTFAQAELAEPLPTQLLRTEISDQLTSLLWVVIHDSLQKSLRWSDAIYAELALYQPWDTILRQWWVIRKHRNVDEFPAAGNILAMVKAEVTSKEYVRVYDFIQFLVRSPNCPSHLLEIFPSILEKAHAPYRIINKTLLPLTTEDEAEAIARALETANRSAVRGPATHLTKAADALSGGQWSESIRESIHAVEAVAKSIEPDAATLGPALNRLQSSIGLNPALKTAFSALYGFTSDEKGIRHSLVFQDEANVEEADAIFMFGACASFVSYLLSKQKSLARTNAH